MEFDPRFKLLLEMFLREFLELFFPEFAARIDWSKPVVHLDKELIEILHLHPKTKTVDELARVHTLDDQEELCLIHIEVEGRKSRTSMEDRMPGYLVRIVEALHLPTLPIAFYINLGGEGIGWQTREMRCFGHVVASFHFPYVGIRAFDGAELVKKSNAFALACAGLARVSPDQRAQIKADALLRVERLRLDEKRRNVLVEAVDAFNKLDENQQQEFERLMQTDPYQKAQQMHKSTFDIVREDSKLEANREMLTELLKSRFGPLPERAKKKLERLSLDEIRKLSIQLLTAERRSDLGL